MTQRADVMQSAVYDVLRPSSRRLLAYVEQQIESNGGNVTMYADEFEKIGSRRIIGPGLSELNALGLLRVARYQKRHLIGLSDGWRAIASRHEALQISATARMQPMPVTMTPPQPVTASSNAPA